MMKPESGPARLGVARRGIPRRAALLLAIGLQVALGAAARAQDGEIHEVLDMSPDNKVGWSMRNLFAPISGLFLGGPGYWYERREIEVRTTPPDGSVDLFYVRANFQKRFEQAETPVTILLPPRIETGPRDSLTIRAFREGYRQQSITLKANTREKQVILDLEPLPNTLQALSHRYFAGRSSLTFLTTELLEFRVQEAEDGFTVILNETAGSEEADASLAAVRSPLVAETFAQQLGEDLLVKVALGEQAQTGIELRSRQAHNPARELYEFTVDLVPRDGGAAAVERALEALAAIQGGDVTGCALRFEAALRERLDQGALSRALTPRGSFTDRYLRAAMRRLGEVTPGGEVSFSDGARFRTAIPIELEAALSQAGGAGGYLALLRRFVSELEAEQHRTETLRGLLAPELDPALFGDFLEEAEKAERDCLAAR